MSHSLSTCKIIHIHLTGYRSNLREHGCTCCVVRKENLMSWKPGKKDRLTIRDIMQLALKLMIILKRKLTAVRLWCAIFNRTCAKVLCDT
jgi:hypothetical protein